MLHSLFPSLALAAGLSAAAGPADGKLPATPAGKRLQEFVTAFNNGDAAALRKLHAPWTTADQAKRRADQDLAFFRDHGRLGLLSVARSAEHEVAVLARTGLTEMVFEVIVVVEKKPPHGLARLGIRTGTAPRGAAGKKLSLREVAAALEAFVEKLAAADRFSGAYLLAHDGVPLIQKAHGLASISFKAPNRIDTKFNLGSMNKMFTAVAVAQLAQRGKLSFDDTLIKHVPDYPNKAVAKQVTIHQLLTHTSGMGSYFNDTFQKASKTRFRALADYLPLFVNDELQFTPGKRFGYSNAGFHVLGMVIEKVSGQDYFAYVRDHICKPAGMTGTDSYEMDQDTPNLAIGYTRMSFSGPTAGARRNNLFLHVVKGGPAGGGFSTAPDLLKFATALRGHKLLDSKHTALVLTGKVAAFGPGTQYGYGFSVATRDGKRVVGHGGGFPGISAQLDIYLDQGYTLAVLSNYDGGAVPVANKVRELLRE